MLHPSYSSRAAIADAFLCRALSRRSAIGLALAALGIVWMQMRKDVGPGKPGIYAKAAVAR